jgi:hypothetical protein
MNKKRVIALLLIITLTGSILLILTQIKGPELEDASTDTNRLASGENQTCNIKITNFQYTSSWGPIVGVEAAISFNLTIHNLGTEDIDGLSVEVKMFDANNRIINTETKFAGLTITEFGTETSIGTLFGGEVCTLQGAVMSDYGTLANAWALGTTTKLSMSS